MFEKNYEEASKKVATTETSATTATTGTKEMTWDDVLENTSPYVLLPEGDYCFTVTDLERGHFPGSAKIGACAQATLTLEVTTKNGIAKCKVFLYSHPRCKQRIEYFFRCIGQLKYGQEAHIDWSKVVGAHGYAHFRPNTYTNKEGITHTYNSVVYYYSYDEKYFTKEDEFVSIPEREETPFD